MPWLEKRGGTYRLKYRFGGKVRQAALKTGDETAARTALAKFKETLSDVLRGRLTIPDGGGGRGRAGGRQWWKAFVA